MVKSSQKRDQLKKSLADAERTEMELDRRMFYLKTLYDVSRDIFSNVEYEPILKTFLLMTMGNFGVVEGFILTMDRSSKEIEYFSSMGFKDTHENLLKTGSKKVLISDVSEEVRLDSACLKTIDSSFPDTVELAIPFKIHPNTLGILGLGQKLVGDSYTENDTELLVTLMNNLVIALKNAQSFEEIRNLNRDLQKKNNQLETALTDLKASMRKVEILEGVKENLSKFVPVTVSRMIEKSPTAAIPKRKRKDLSVLFLDIEGYTKLCSKLGSKETSEIIERHFSVFMDAIYAHNGDVNETAGDGLMVLFLNDDKQTNALEAVQTALTVREETVRICSDFSVLYRPLDINMGINSGEALVGAAKFDTYSGSRWTYTATGNLTNVAARIGSLAKKGEILLSKSTSDRIKGNVPFKYKGSFSLKNISDEVEVFKV